MAISFLPKTPTLLHGVYTVSCYAHNTVTEKPAHDLSQADSIARLARVKPQPGDTRPVYRRIAVSIARSGTIVERWENRNGSWKRLDEGLLGVRAFSP